MTHIEELVAGVSSHNRLETPRRIAKTFSRLGVPIAIALGNLMSKKHKEDLLCAQIRTLDSGAHVNIAMGELTNTFDWVTHTVKGSCSTVLHNELQAFYEKKAQKLRNKLNRST